MVYKCYYLSISVKVEINSQGEGEIVPFQEPLDKYNGNMHLSPSEYISNFRTNSRHFILVLYHSYINSRIYGHFI